MDNKDKELELKKLEIEKLKLEIEKLKIKEGLFRTLIIIILTAGAGFGAVLYKINLNILSKYLNIINILLIIFLGLLILSLSLISYFVWKDIRKKLKEL